VSAAVHLKKRLVWLNGQWKSFGYPHLNIRVGINTARCLVGNVGSVQRMQFTALGDGVNIASRLESLNKRYQSGILISQTTYESVKDHFLCRWMCYAQLKGKKKPINIYEVINTMEHAILDERETCILHEQARDSCDRNEFHLAIEACNHLIHKDSNNHAAIELLNCLQSKQFTTSIVLELLDK
jgi:adenylate cyclase